MTDPVRPVAPRATEILREVDSYRGAIRDAFEEAFALSKLEGSVSAAWERSEARQVDAAFALTRIGVGAIMRELLAAAPVPCAASPAPTLEVIVNGQPVVVPAGSVREIIEQAIRRSGQIGAPVAQWELRTTEGDIIPHDLTDGTDYELTPGRRLWLNLGPPLRATGEGARDAELRGREEVSRSVEHTDRSAHASSGAVTGAGRRGNLASDNSHSGSDDSVAVSLDTHRLQELVAELRRQSRFGLPPRASKLDDWADVIEAELARLRGEATVRVEE